MLFGFFFFLKRGSLEKVYWTASGKSDPIFSSVEKVPDRVQQK